MGEHSLPGWQRADLHLQRHEWVRTLRPFDLLVADVLAGDRGIPGSDLDCICAERRGRLNVGALPAGFGTHASINSCGRVVSFRCSRERRLVLLQRPRTERISELGSTKKNSGGLRDQFQEIRELSSAETDRCGQPDRY